MMGLRDRVIAGAIAAATMAAYPASAATTTRTYSIALSDFVDTVLGQPSAPIASLAGTFAVTFDPDVDHVDEQAGLSVTGFDTLQITDYAYTYSKDDNILAFGGLLNGVTILNDGTTDFGIFLDVTDPLNPIPINCGLEGLDCGSARGDASYAAAVYTVADQPGSGFFARSALVTAAVPEPGTWAMMLLGFAMTAAASRYRRRWMKVPMA